MIVELKDKNGSVIHVLNSDYAPFTFDLETIWGKKTYSLKFNHPRDPQTRQKDESRITGAMLNID